MTTIDQGAWACYFVGLTLLSLLPCCTRRGRRHPLGDQCVLPLCCPPFLQLAPALPRAGGGERDTVRFRGKADCSEDAADDDCAEELGLEYRKDASRTWLAKFLIPAGGGGLPWRDGPPPALWRVLLDAVLPRFAFGLLGGYLLTAVTVFVYLLSVSGNRFPALSGAACVDQCAPTDAYCCSYEAPGIPHEEVWLPSGGGGRVHAWWIHARNTSSALTLLYNHGSGSNIASMYRIQRYEFLRSLDVNVFVYDYPGYGRSEGVPTEEGCIRAADDALQYVLTRTGQSSEDILCLGRSMGGALAMHLASEHTFRGVVLQSAFTTMADYGRERAPLVWWLIAWAKLLGGWDNISKMRHLDSCLLEYHSKADEWVPYEQGRQLFTAARNARPQCKVWVEDDKALHDDALTEQEKVALARWVSLMR